MTERKNIFNNTRTMDLSRGNIVSMLLIFAVPLLLGQLFQTFYNSVDSIVIGNYESAEALAAVSASSTVSMIISGFFSGLSAGATAMLSRLFGGRDYKRLHDAVHTTVLFSLVLGVVLSAAGILLSPALLRLTACPEDIFEMAVTYLRIYLIGILFTSIYNIGAGILRSVGDSLWPFIFLVISSLMNIGLDILFVGSFHMGVAGVAVATIIAQAVSMVLVFWKVMRLDDAYRFRFSHLMIDWKLLREVVRLGLPAGLQTSITAISNLFVQSYINSFNSVAIAGIASGMRIDQYVGMPCMTLGLAMTTFIGQNLGAGRNDRAHKSVWISTLMCAGFVILLSIPACIFAPQLVRIFSPDLRVIEYGGEFLRTIMPLYIFFGLNGLFAGILRGYKYSLTSMICSVCGMVAMRQIWLAVTLNLIAHNIQFVYYCYPVGWVISGMSMVAIYLIRIRKKYPKEPEAKAAEA